MHPLSGLNETFWTSSVSDAMSLQQAESVAKITPFCEKNENIALRNRLMKNTDSKELVKRHLSRLVSSVRRNRDFCDFFFRLFCHRRFFCSNFFVFQSCELRFSEIFCQVLIRSFPGSFGFFSYYNCLQVVGYSG